MKASFIIYCRAVGLYVLLSLPALVIPLMYILSLYYVLTFGWLAWIAFTVLYIIIDNLVFDFVPKLMVLFVAVVIAVAFAYYMLGIIIIRDDIWHTGFIAFPFAAVIAGWISVCISKERIRSSCYEPETSSPATNAH